MVPFTTRAKAYEYLRGHWHGAVTVQILVFLCEVILLFTAVFLPGNTVLNSTCALLVDFLLISPLKAGRALYFETLVADGSAVHLKLLFRYYRHGYERTIGWRLLLWCARGISNAVCCIPAFFLFAYSHLLAERSDLIPSLTMFGFGLLLLVSAIVTTEIILLRFTPIPYLFAHTGSLREAVAVSRRITAGRMNTLASLYLDHAGWLFAVLLFVPWFFTSASFQTARAATVRRFLREIPSKNTSSVLQRQKKYGRIGR